MFKTATLIVTLLGASHAPVSWAHDDSAGKKTLVKPREESLRGAPPLPPPLELIEHATVCTRPYGLLDLEWPSDSSGRRFHVCQSGQVHVESNDGVFAPEPFLQLDATTPGGFWGGGEAGLLGIAFHPAPQGPQRLFVFYSQQHALILAEYRARTDDPDRADLSTRREIMKLRRSGNVGDHNGGRIFFAPDGLLYLSVGDGQGDPQVLSPSAVPNEHRSRALGGKILRIDVDHSSPAGTPGICAGADDDSANYVIPSANPFAQVPANCGEILHYGLRNPWRFNIDATTGTMYIGDVGNDLYEEIDVVGAADVAANFGYPCVEGDHVTGWCASLPAGLTSPLVTHAHDGNVCSVIGGFVWRGASAGWHGRYLFADYCAGDLFYAEPSGSGWQWLSAPVIPAVTLFGVRSLAQSPNGTLFILLSENLLEISEALLADGFE
jgi:glucose/arabinose dehydrogenase